MALRSCPAAPEGVLEDSLLQPLTDSEYDVNSGEEDCGGGEDAKAGHQSRAAPGRRRLGGRLWGLVRAVGSAAGLRRRAQRPEEVTPRSEGWSLRMAVGALGVYLLAALALFVVLRGQFSEYRTNVVVDALYFSVVTLTTTGYGDVVPTAPLAKLFTCLLIFSSIAIVGSLLSVAGSALIERQEDMIIQAASGRQQVEDLDSLAVSEADVTLRVAAGLVLMVACLVVGVTVITLVEGLSLVDSIYLACVSLSTVGYGDLGFRTLWGRIFAIFWLLTATLVVARTLFLISEATLEHKQRMLIQRMLTRAFTASDFFAADSNKDLEVDEAEFILYKLRELGKVEDSDVCAIREQFRAVDVDQSGAITLSDIVALKKRATPALSSKSG